MNPRDYLLDRMLASSVSKYNPERVSASAFIVSLPRFARTVRTESVPGLTMRRDDAVYDSMKSPSA